MRKIKNKEREKAGNLYCSYCRPLKVDAIYRKIGITACHKTDYACEMHKIDLQQKVAHDNMVDDSDLSEADYQTWMRL